ncbi:MAG: TIGR02647 family protein [Hahellaceae bacterium]|jgi:uncharacterized protein (TIGR02647 family)|nr:TIGR02647 family protein [Hahellaceae bacterium]MCP5211388.1 TIGR02647 family protein [Hahellaceae bacterium]
MPFSKELVDEINVLIKFNLHTSQEGIKVHKTAAEDTISATKRLFEKGLVTQDDGGYLTFAGRETAEHAQALHDMLTLGEAQEIES